MLKHRILRWLFYNQTLPAYLAGPRKEAKPMIQCRDISGPCCAGCHDWTADGHGPLLTVRDAQGAVFALVCCCKLRKARQQMRLSAGKQQQIRDDSVCEKSIDMAKLTEENERLREAGGYLLGWHPTDPEHPAFADTQAYGRDMMCRLLARYEVVSGNNAQISIA